MPRFVKSLILVCLSAVLWALPFHFSELSLLAYLAFVPYFFALTHRTVGESFMAAYLFGCVAYALLGYWLTFVSGAGFVLMVIYLALYPALFGVSCHAFLNPSQEWDRWDTWKNIKTAFFVPAFWVVLEWIRGWMISGIPWALLAYTQWKNTAWIQIADITGAYGVSFFVMQVNWIFFRILQTFVLQATPEAAMRGTYKRRALRALLSLLGFGLLTVGGYGFFVLKERDAFYEDQRPKARIRISVVQGNIPQEQKWDAKIKKIIFEKYRRLTFMSAIERSDLIVWPETSFPGYLEDEPMMAAELRKLVRQSRTEVLVGAPTVGNLAEGLRFYNSAILYHSDGEEKQRYHKVHLVPFGEYVPFEPILGVIRSFAHIGHFTAGRELTVFKTQTRYQAPNIRANFAVLICFEDIFPGLVRGFCRRGAHFLLNITNDAWFGKTSAPYQHAQASVFRAVENRVPVVRAANTGFSCFISSEGRILDRVEDNGEEIFVTGHKSYMVTLRKSASFYTRFGDVFLIGALALCFLAYREKTRPPAH